MNRSGIILLEVMIALVIIGVGIVETGRLFSVISYNRSRMQNAYVQLYAARKNLLNAYGNTGLDSGLSYTAVSPGLVLIKDDKTRLWLYRYE